MHCTPVSPYKSGCAPQARTVSASFDGRTQAIFHATVLPKRNAAVGAAAVLQEPHAIPKTHLAPDVIVVVAVPLAEATARTLLIVAPGLDVPPVLRLDVVAVAVGIPSDEIARLQRLPHRRKR